ncbi:Hypothetical protein D9617_10g073110 [Elsinoe fawcettii]|nr:Hypothetical protein D9617_10g073110 [Elsinoe fawcettii]
MNLKRRRRIRHRVVHAIQEVIDHINQATRVSSAAAARSSNRISIHLHQTVGGSEAQRPSYTTVSKEIIAAGPAAPSHHDPVSANKSTQQEKVKIQSDVRQEENAGYGYLQSDRSLSPREAMAQAQTLDDILETKTQEWVASHSAKSRTSTKPPSKSVPHLSSAPNPSVSTKADSKATKSESSIRKIAREEVVKYRQAERQVENHPTPYAYMQTTQVSAPGECSTSTLDSRSRAAKGPESQETDVAAASRSTRVKSENTNTEASKTTKKSTTVKQASVTTGSWTAPTRNPPGQASAAEEDPSRDRRETYPASSHGPVNAPQAHRPQYQSREPTSDAGYEQLSSRIIFRRRRSFETDYTVRPDSSISQRPPVYFVDRGDARLREISDPDRIAVDAQRMVSDARGETHREFEGASRYVDLIPQRQPPSDLPSRSAPPLPSAPRNLSAAAVNLAQQTRLEGAEQFERSIENTSRHPNRHYDTRPPSPPTPPPMESRFADNTWTYQEDVSPNRVRVVRERLIRSRPSSPERPTAPQAPTGPKVKRYEIVESVRSLPEDRGRSKVREGDEQPKKRLRSILRSPGASQYASQYDGRNPRSESISRRVSFSEAIDVTMLSPPPSSSNLGDSGRRDRRSSRRSGRTRNPRYDNRGSSSYDEADDERYYYERARRPDPPIPSRSTRVSDAETGAIDRRRALARALSESPSRERGIHIIDGSRRSAPSGDAAERSQRHEPRQPGTPLSYPLPPSGAGSDHSDGLGPYAPFISPTSSMASNDGRAPILMSGGLSGFSTVRGSSQRSAGLPSRPQTAPVPPQRVQPIRPQDMPPPPVIARSTSVTTASYPPRYPSDSLPDRMGHSDRGETRAASDFYLSRPSRSQRSPPPPTETRYRSSTVYRDERTDTRVARVRDDGRSPSPSHDVHRPARHSDKGGRSESSRYDDRRGR